MTRRPFLIGPSTPTRLANRLLGIMGWRVRRYHNDNSAPPSGRGGGHDPSAVSPQSFDWEA